MAKKSSNKVVIVVVVILALCAIVAAGYYFFLREKPAPVLEYFNYTEKYESLTAESSSDDIRLALDDLKKGESECAVDSYDYSQICYFEANLYKRLEEAENEIEVLKKIEQNAKSSNYLKALAIYRLAVCNDNLSLENEAINYYKLFLEKFGNDHIYSQNSMFSIFRLYFIKGDAENTKLYLDLLENTYPGTPLVEFAKSLQVEGEEKSLSVQEN